MPNKVVVKKMLFLTFKIPAKIFGTKKGIGNNLATKSKVIGWFSTKDLNLEIILYFGLVDASPQLYFINKKASIAPIVAANKQTMKPKTNPNKIPAKIFKNGFTGTEKNTVKI